MSKVIPLCLTGQLSERGTDSIVPTMTLHTRFLFSSGFSRYRHGCRALALFLSASGFSTFRTRHRFMKKDTLVQEPTTLLLFNNSSTVSSAQAEPRHCLYTHIPCSQCSLISPEHSVMWKNKLFHTDVMLINASGRWLPELS